MSENQDLVEEAQMILKIAEAIKGADEEQRRRIYEWLGSTIKKIPSSPTARATAVSSGPVPGREDSASILGFDDIAVQGENGIDLVFTDPKAKNKKDALLRIAYVVCYMHEKLLGNPVVSRATVYEHARKYGAYDSGNSPAQITRERAIQKLNDGKDLQLTMPAKAHAEKIITEIRSNEDKGKWSPNRSGKVRKTKTAKSSGGN